MDETDAGFLRLVRRRKRHERERTTKGEPPSRLIDAKIKELDGWRGNGLAPIDNDVLERDIRPFVVAELAGGAR